MSRRSVTSRAIDSVAAMLEPGAAPAHEILVRLLTIDAKLPYHLAMRRLLPREQSLVNELQGRDDIHMVAAEDQAYATCNVLVSYSRLGKLSLYVKDMETPPEDAALVGGLMVDAAILDRVHQEARQEAVLEQRERRHIDQVLDGWQARGELAARVQEAADWVDHVETVYLYVDRQAFSRSDVGNNLLRDRYLERLESTPVDRWLPAERVFLFAIHALFRTGRSIRFEEFNGLELGARALRGWLTDKHCLYHEVLGRDVPEAELQLPLLSLATRVGELAAEVDGSGWLRMRRINGVTITKQEALVPPEQAAARELRTLPRLLAGFAAETLDLAVDPLVSAPERAMEAITLASLHRDMDSGKPVHLERIIECIVLSAVIEANADYGMSSSLRDFSRLQGSAEARAAGALSMSKPDFFTCVLQHPVRTRHIPDADMARILQQVAARMEFNRWHFLAGNFERHEVPRDRHYYFPPTMPDIAEWSDAWHGGHVSAAVRYSIRAPGAQLWNQPLLAFGHGYRGIYDIRLVRMEGPGFTMDEMFAASRHSTLIDLFWRTLMRQIHDGLAVPAIASYDRDWYVSDMKWKDTVAALETWR